MVEVEVAVAGVDVVGELDGVVVVEDVDVVADVDVVDAAVVVALGVHVNVAYPLPFRHSFGLVGKYPGW